MKLLIAVLLTASLVSAQQNRKTTAPSHTQPPYAEAQSSDMNALWAAELPNLKSDLAELRAMLNVLGSQEMSLDTRTSGAFQTNRQMWQVVIARLAELTQRMDAIERSQGRQLPRPHPEQP